MNIFVNICSIINKEILADICPIVLLSAQKLWGKTLSNILLILLDCFGQKLVQATTERNMCTEFEGNRLKFSTSEVIYCDTNCNFLIYTNNLFNQIH